jgi:hypothetical protein
MSENIPYRGAFPVGTEVRVADLSFLEAFKTTWKFHHKLQGEQLAYAGRTAKADWMTASAPLTE